MREAAAFLLLACACGAATLKGRAEDARSRTGVATGRDETGAPGAGDSTGRSQGFASLEARSVALAPGLRQAAERESGNDRLELVRAIDHDACVRVAFESTAPVSARLLDASGGVLAETAGAATAGALGERGPVCIRKGDAVSAIAEGAGARVKWIAWTAP